MKNVLIIGANGSLATVVTESLKNISDVKLTLFVRDKRNLQNPYNLDIVEGDALNYNDIKTAITGKDIVYVNLAGDLNSMSKNIVQAMQDTGVKRVIAISSIGIFDKPLKSVLIPYKALSDNIENSDLDYTILRPNWFTNGKEIDFTLTKKGTPEVGTAVSKKSIAAFITSIIENPSLYVRENLGISKPN